MFGNKCWPGFGFEILSLSLHQFGNLEILAIFQWVHGDSGSQVKQLIRAPCAPLHCTDLDRQNIVTHTQMFTHAHTRTHTLTHIRKVTLTQSE